MLKDYHLHPMIMLTPEENFDGFVEKELSLGVEEICITDHMPLLRCNGNVDRIPMGKISAYCDKVDYFKQKYRDKISIKCGIEIDFHPTMREHIEQLLKEGEGRFDFILGSTHLPIVVPSAFADFPSPSRFAAAALDNVLTATKSGYFNAISHLDQFKNMFFGGHFDKGAKPYCPCEHFEKIDEILDEIKKRDLRLEINARYAIFSKTADEVYPTTSIITRALDKGLKFSYGSDAHAPNEAGFKLLELREQAIYGKALRQWEKE